MKKIFKLAANFSRKLKEIVEGVKAGVQLFKDIISGKLNLKDIIADFIDAITHLPEKVLGLRRIASTAWKKIGQFDPKDLPQEFQPVINFIRKVTKLFNDIKTDVMGFVYEVEQAIKVVIPQQATAIYHGIKDIINGFSIILKNPKEAIMDEKPYWFNVHDLWIEYSAMANSAFKGLNASGQKWVNESINEGEDEIMKFSKGKSSYKKIRKEIVDNFITIKKELIDPFKDLVGLADAFVNTYGKVFKLIKSIKDAYNILKEGYETARGIIDALFGTRAHKLFPVDRREVGDGCSGNGQYPSSLGSGHTEYRHDGIDLLIEMGAEIVAPFAGEITIDPEDSSTVIIKISRGSLNGTAVMITNIDPSSEIVDEESKWKLFNVLG
ncbi:uncharacterized protein LOC134277750 [Saccostrea cucullata]|uniref:uncharacterized protein LOC134277750 n=1 Tax=Saccostrea cuccullata TaxID=36930 RepID=UPI002ED311EE